MRCWVQALTGLGHDPDYRGKISAAIQQMNLDYNSFEGL
jgi:hypothetical protein